MKKIFIYLFLVCLSVMGSPINHVAYAQTQTANSYAGTSKALSELVNGIEPSMLTDRAAKNKGVWLEKTNKIGSYGDAAKLLGKLGNNIRPEAFTSSFNRTDWTTSLKDVASGSDLSSAISKLTGGMKDSAFTPSFQSNKATWLSGLNDMVK